MPHTRTLRDPDVLRAEYERVLSESTVPLTPARRGVLASLGWVLGEVATSPAYERFSPAPPTLQEIGREENAARDALYRRHDTLTLQPGYAVAVEHALMWVRGATDDPLDYS